jgi:capsid portal protein
MKIKGRSVVPDGNVNLSELKKTVGQVVALVSGSGPTQGKLGAPSRAVIDDPFERMQIDGIVLPPVSPLEWCRLSRVSNILPQMMRALEIGIEGYGYHFPESPEVQTDEQKAEVWAGIEKEMGAMAGTSEVERPVHFIVAKDMDELLDRELEALERAFDHFSPFESFVDVRRNLRNDKESIGYWTMETLRDGIGRICGGAHVPSYQVRLTVIDEEPTDFEYRYIGHDWTWRTETRQAYFRRFVQIKGQRKHYYKQFGDPRNYSYLSGREITNPDARTAANELIYCRNYVAGTDYGMPDWSGQAANIGGSYKLEQANFRHFASKMIPAMILLVMGGSQITQGDLDRIFEEFEKIKGDDSENKIMIVQLPSGIQDVAAGGKIDSPKAILQGLTQLQKQDATHLKYNDANIKGLMSARRIPPILLGMSADYNRATSDAAERMFERYVAKPERNQFDFLINRLWVMNMGIRFHEFESKGPDLTDTEVIARVGAAVASMGGVSIDAAIELGNKWLGLDVEPMGGEDGKLPIAVLIEKYRAQSFQMPVGLTEDANTQGRLTDLLTRTLVHVHEQARRSRDARSAKGKA